MLSMNKYESMQKLAKELGMLYLTMGVNKVVDKNRLEGPAALH